MSTTLRNILLVEDNEGDVEWTQLAFKRSNIAVDLKVAYDGMEAMDYLATLEDGQLPDLILLDLNMPRMDGKTFLTLIKKDERLKSIPVIVLTSSDALRDVKDCYARYANCYIIKPFNFDDLVVIVKQIESFWINLIQLPQRSG